jgi:hypothetical protein
MKEKEDEEMTAVPKMRTWIMLRTEDPRQLEFEQAVADLGV